jgi:ATP-binding cassette, subfamily B, bacterial
MSQDELHEEHQRRRLELGLWRRILAHARPYRLPLAGLAVAGLIIAGIDSLLPRVTGLLIDEATTRGDRGLIGRYIFYYVGLIALMATLIWAFIVAAGQAATGFAFDLRRAAFARLQEMSFSFYDRRPVGWLMARLTSDCERVSGIIPWFLLDIVWGTALLIGVSAMMLHLDVKLALLVMSTLPPLAVVSLYFQRKLLTTQRAVRKTNSALTASFNEAIMGVRTTKTLVREEESLGEFQVLSGQMYGYSVHNSVLAAVYLPIVITLGSVGVGLALWRGGVVLGGGMSLGTLVAFMQYAAFFYMPVQEMAERFTQLQAAQASAERIQGLLDTQPEIADSPEVAEKIANGGAIVESIRSIEFRNVSFTYKEGELVLADFNLRVAPGESIALVGATGSGKSTIVSLLSRFYEPSGGTILLNGRDYREWGLTQLQSKLGVVLQTPHLFSGTIRENVRYGRLTASDDEVAEAARLANADPFISLLEKGYETDVGEGGNRLSTGQKQLISLARAILADPEILIMDEATSSVDTETERLIQKGIERVLEGRISFIIAHRLSTVRSASRILVIDKGRIVEEGAHDHLMRERGRYYSLYTNQLTQESQERVLQEAGRTA